MNPQKKTQFAKEIDKSGGRICCDVPKVSFTDKLRNMMASLKQKLSKK